MQSEENNSGRAYEAMARRYRPQSFDDVVGQEHVAKTLKNAILSSRVAHAYLFCGPHGCGKTSMARIFACALVCEQGPTSEPCGKCPICLDVLRGQDVDIQEIDGASNNGVEQVRSLREQAGYIPSRARYKIYIIDEVHMLSVAAFNALLKTLEEPPPHVKFILATTDPHKIIGTILSRCQRFDFRLVPPPKMSAFFQKLIEKENAEITEEALDAVSAFSGGSVRDGLVLLDQLVSYSQGKVTREDVERVRGVAGAEAVAGIYEAIASHNIASALGIVDEVAQRGTNAGDFLDQLIEYGRDLMLVCGTGREDGVSAYGPARKVLLELANALSLDFALLALDVFAQARTRVRSRALSNPLVPLEMAVARLAGIENLQPVNELIKKLDAYSRGAPAPEVAAPSPVAATVPEPPAPPVSYQEPPSNPAPQNPAEVSSSAPYSVTHQAEPVSTPSTLADGKIPPVEPEKVTALSPDDASQRPPWEEKPSASASSAPVELGKLWADIRRLLSEKNPADLSLLGDVHIDRIEGNRLFLSVPGGGSFIFEQLEDGRRKAHIASCAAEVLGHNVEVNLTLREAISEQPAESRMEARMRTRREAETDPGVSMILNNFNGEIVNVEEPS